MGSIEVEYDITGGEGTGKNRVGGKEGEVNGKMDGMSNEARIRATQQRRELATDLRRRLKLSHRLLIDDEDYQVMRRNFQKGFFDKWEIGFHHYLDGDWEKATPYFEETLVVNFKIEFQPGNG